MQRWEFAKSTEGWYRQPFGAVDLKAEDGCLGFWITRRRNFNIRQRVMPFESSRYRMFRIRMKIVPNANAGQSDDAEHEMRLKWGTKERPIIGRGLVVDDKRCVATCPVEVDGEFHEYAIDLSGNRDWNGMVDELWFEACQAVHARAFIDWMRFE